VQAFGSLRDTGEVEPLVQAFRNVHDSWVIESVIRALGFRNFLPPEVGVRLHEQTWDAGWVREAAAWALARFRNSQAVDLLAPAFANLRNRDVIVPLIQSLKDPNEQVREQAAWALERLSAAVLRALVSHDERVRVEAARTLVSLRCSEPFRQVLGKLHEDEEVEPPIEALTGEALTDPIAEVREAVAWVLGWLRDKCAVEPLIKRLANKEEEASVRQAAATALGALSDPRAVPQLMQALTTGENLRTEATEALSLLGEPAVKPLLDDALTSPRPRVRQAAAEALGKLRDGRAEALGKLRDGRAVEPLIERLGEDSDRFVRGEAAEALGRLGDTRAFKPLIQALKDADTSVQEAAVQALGELGDRRALKPLQQLAASVPRHELLALRIEKALQKLKGGAAQSIPAGDVHADRVPPRKVRRKP
jgi:HEAT repeat protein